MKITKIVVLFLLLVSFIFAQKKEGKLVDVTIPAPSLKNSLIYESPNQNAFVYLPPSYENSSKQYPVVYFLPGFSSPVKSFNDLQERKDRHIKSIMDDLINLGQINEMIIVVPNGMNALGGAFYINSPVMGNWEDYIIYDVVNYVDKKYRTLKNPESRGIAGHSMGGSGALNLAMLHPEIFSVVYGLAPGLFDRNGLKDMTNLSSEVENRKTFNIIDECKIAKGKEKEALVVLVLRKFAVEANYLYGDFFGLSYAMAFASAPGKGFPFCDFLYEDQNGKLIFNEKSIEKFENGFGNLENKIVRYKENLKKLKGIYIDYPDKDDLEWIPRGSKYFSELLNKYGISNTLLEHKGNHNGENIGQQIRNSVIPVFSKHLKN